MKTQLEPYLAKQVDQRFFIEGFPKVFERLEAVEAKPPFITKQDAQVDLLTAEFYDHSRDVIFCDTCGRLWLQRPGESTFDAYVKEAKPGVIGS